MDEQAPVEQLQETGPGGVPLGTKTSDVYATRDIPKRFDNPGVSTSHLVGNPIFSCKADIEIPSEPQPRLDEWFQGYVAQPQHPMYRTTAAAYGSKAPSVHTMPTSFSAKSQKFSEHLGICGMYRNHSLNTSMDQSRV